MVSQAVPHLLLTLLSMASGDFAGGEGDEEEFTITAGGHNDGDDKFDLYVGVLQDIVMEEEFEKRRQEFVHENCQEFQPLEENKLSYTAIFKEYQNNIEAYLMERMGHEISDFSMEYFSNELLTRKDEIDEQIMDLLLSFSDFVQFKEMMLFEKAHFVATTPQIKKKAKAVGLKDTLDFGKDQIPVDMAPEIKLEGSKPTAQELKYFENHIDLLVVNGKATKLNKNEDEEGEERPDLSFGIQGMKI